MRFLVNLASLALSQVASGTRLHSSPDEFEDYRFSSTMFGSEIAENSMDSASMQRVPESTTSVYREWIAQLFGLRGVPAAVAPVSQFSVRSDDSDWVIVDPIRKRGPVFLDLWDPEMSGDWTPIVPLAPPPRYEEETDTEFTEPELEDRSTGSLLRWAFRTGAPADELGRDLERMSVWQHFVARKLDMSLPSYLESVVIELPESVEGAIARDVARTDPPHLRPRITRVLMAYAARNPSVGFCQGMSYLVSGLLQQSWVTDEIAFHLLSVIAENVNAEYYNDELSGLHADLKRIEKFLLYVSRVRKFQVPLMLVLVEPMMCVLTRLSPPEVAVRIFDIMFTHEKVGLFAVYLGILDLVHAKVARAISESDSADSAMVDGVVAFKLALVELLGRDPDRLIRRAEAVLITHRIDIEQILSDSFGIEDEEEEIELVPTLRPLNEFVSPQGDEAFRAMDRWLDRARSAFSAFSDFVDRVMEDV